MKAVAVVRRRVVVARDASVEIVIWQLPEAVPPAVHRFKYRLAYVVSEHCVLRHDNQRGKGDHRHRGTSETPYVFSTLERLMAAFAADIARWDHEHGRA